MKRIALLLASLLLTSCAGYQSSVDSRSIGIQGTTDGQNSGGKIIYAVHYR